MNSVSVYSAQPYEQDFFNRAAATKGIALDYIDAPLTEHTASLATGSETVCVFVNDKLNAQTLSVLSAQGVQHIALRCAGFNNVDLAAARRLGIMVTRVPAYSPEAVAEHTLALVLTLNRRLHKAYNRVKEDNFSLNGLMGFNLRGKTVGIIGTGNIGALTARLFAGFGCNVLAFDPQPDDRLSSDNIEYTSLPVVFSQSDIISLHCPLNQDNHHLIDQAALARMKQGVMLINTSRGGLIDTHAVIDALKTGKLGYLGLDVYEMESELFFKDRSSEVIQDDVFQRLLTFPNVLITGHQGFFTQEALAEIANTTLDNIVSATELPQDGWRRLC